MARGPEPTPGPTIFSATDLTDEIRRHLRTLSTVLKRGPGKTVLFGAETKIAEVDVACVQRDLDAALQELTQLKEQLKKKPSRP